jgi:hypothetical protein
MTTRPPKTRTKARSKRRPVVERTFAVDHIEGGRVHTDTQVVRTTALPPAQGARLAFQLPENNLFTIPGVTYETTGTASFKRYATRDEGPAQHEPNPYQLMAQQQQAREPYVSLVSDATEEGRDPVEGEGVIDEDGVFHPVRRAKTIEKKYVIPTAATE